MQLMINAHADDSDDKQEDKDHDKDFKEIYGNLGKRSKYNSSSITRNYGKTWRRN